MVACSAVRQTSWSAVVTHSAVYYFRIKVHFCMGSVMSFAVYTSIWSEIVSALEFLCIKWFSPVVLSLHSL